MPENARDRGAVTVEAAVALCSLLVVFGLVLGGISAVTGQLRCTDAAGAAARMMIRGDDRRARQLVRSLAPAGARMLVRTNGRKISVTVLAEPLGGMLPGIELRAQAHGVLEPGVDPPNDAGAVHAGS